MPCGSSSAAGDVGVARTGSRITRAMQPSAARRRRVVFVPSISEDDDRRRTRNHWRSRHRPRMSVPVGAVVSAHRDEVVEAGE
jgi:hypothetical protein